MNEAVPEPSYHDIGSPADSQANPDICPALLDRNDASTREVTGFMVALE
jgi:hypothetical protein